MSWDSAIVVARIGVAIFFLAIADRTVASFISALSMALRAGMATAIDGQPGVAQERAPTPATAVLAVPGWLYPPFMLVVVSSGVRRGGFCAIGLRLTFE